MPPRQSAVAQGPRRPTALANMVAKSASRVLPALAPIIIQRAASKLRACAIAKDEMRITAARLETQTMARIIPAAKEKSAMFCRISKKDAISGFVLNGAVETTIWLMAIMMKAKPKRMRPNCPGRVEGLQ